MGKNIRDEISRCIIRMLVDEPYYAHFLSAIVRKVSNEIPTAAVGLNFNDEPADFLRVLNEVKDNGQNQ